MARLSIVRPAGSTQGTSGCAGGGGARGAAGGGGGSAAAAQGRGLCQDVAGEAWLGAERRWVRGTWHVQGARSSA